MSPRTSGSRSAPGGSSRSIGRSRISNTRPAPTNARAKSAKKIEKRFIGLISKPVAVQNSNACEGDRRPTETSRAVNAMTAHSASMMTNASTGAWVWLNCVTFMYAPK